MLEQKLFEMFMELKETSSRNSKLELLDRFLLDSYFHKTIIFLYDNSKITNISKKKIKKNIDVEPNYNIENYESFLFFLENHVDGKDSSIKSIQNYINRFDKNISEFLVLIAIKNLKTGVNVKTLNKSLENNSLSMIFDIQVQLASSFKKFEQKELVKNPNILEKFWITQKLDGIRCVIVKNNNKINAYSRSGKPIDGLIEIFSDFESQDYPNDFVFDGELLAENVEKLNSGDLYRKTNTIVSSKGEKSGLIYNIFDIMPTEEFNQGISKLKYSERRKQLDKIKETNVIKIVPVLYTGTDIEKIKEIGDKAINNGLEGVMINTNDYYKGKRVKSLLKVKQFISSDGIIKGVYEGDNKYTGKLGGLFVTYSNIVIKIGSGFSDEQRENYWKNPEAIIGKVCEYEYTEQSRDKEGNIDLRFCRFKGLRLDKEAKDVSYDN